MKLSDVERFDASMFTKDELEDYRKFANSCVNAKTVASIELVGAELDSRRVDLRSEMQEFSQRAKSLNALYKELVKEVPRRLDKAVRK